MSFSVAMLSDASASNDVLPVTVIDLTTDTPTYYAVDIPWFYQEHSGSCGAASLRTAFGQLGYHLNESEIRIAAQTTSTTTLSGDMVRAAHFSLASEEGSGSPIHGYTGKPFGTDSYETAFYVGTPSSRDVVNEFLKQRLLEGRPVILLMSYRSGSSSGHYRVLRGYDDRKGTFIFTDSLGSDPASGSHWTVYSDSLYTNYWDYSGHWAQIISPWNVSLTPVTSPSPGGNFQLDAIIDSGVPSSDRFAPWSLQNASIKLELPDGYSLSSGTEDTVFSFNPSGQALVSWQIQAPLAIENTDIITAGVTGWINGSGTHPWQVKPYDYCDAVYHETSMNLTDWSPPEMTEFAVSSDTEGVLTVNASLTDDVSVQSARLHWRMSATNWTIANMQFVEGLTWQASGLIPVDPKGDEVLQFQVHADDDSGNSLHSSIYECDYDFTTYTTTTESTTETVTTTTEPTSGPPPEPIPLEVVVLVILGAVSVIIIVMIVQKRQ